MKDNMMKDLDKVMGTSFVMIVWAIITCFYAHVVMDLSIDSMTLFMLIWPALTGMSLSVHCEHSGFLIGIALVVGAAMYPIITNVFLGVFLVADVGFGIWRLVCVKYTNSTED